jgi:hypothetical protein
VALGAATCDGIEEYRRVLHPRLSIEDHIKHDVGVDEELRDSRHRSDRHQGPETGGARRFPKTGAPGTRSAPAILPGQMLLIFLAPCSITGGHSPQASDDRRDVPPGGRLQR